MRTLRMTGQISTCSRGPRIHRLQGLLGTLVSFYTLSMWILYAIRGGRSCGVNLFLNISLSLSQREILYCLCVKMLTSLAQMGG